MGVAAQSRDLLLAEEDILMFIWTLMFLTLALIAAVLGFTDFAGTGSPVAWILFVSFFIRVRRQPDHRASRIERVARTLAAEQ